MKVLDAQPSIFRNAHQSCPILLASMGSYYVSVRTIILSGEFHVYARRRRPYWSLLYLLSPPRSTSLIILICNALHHFFVIFNNCTSSCNPEELPP